MNRRKTPTIIVGWTNVPPKQSNFMLLMKIIIFYLLLNTGKLIIINCTIYCVQMPETSKTKLFLLPEMLVEYSSNYYLI